MNTKKWAEILDKAIGGPSIEKAYNEKLVALKAQFQGTQWSAQQAQQQMNDLQSQLNQVNQQLQGAGSYGGGLSFQGKPIAPIAPDPIQAQDKQDWYMMNNKYFQYTTPNIIYQPTITTTTPTTITLTAPNTTGGSYTIPMNPPTYPVPAGGGWEFAPQPQPMPLPTVSGWEGVALEKVQEQAKRSNRKLKVIVVSAEWLHCQGASQITMIGKALELAQMDPLWWSISPQEKSWDEYTITGIEAMKGTASGKIALEAKRLKDSGPQIIEPPAPRFMDLASLPN